MKFINLILAVALVGASACAEEKKQVGETKAAVQAPPLVVAPTPVAAPVVAVAAAASCPADVEPPHAGAFGQIAIQVQAAVDPCSVQGYAIARGGSAGPETSQSLARTTSGDYVIDDLPQGTYDVVVVGQLTVAALAEGSVPVGLRLSGVAVENGSRKEVGAVELALLGEIRGHVGLQNQPEGASRAGVEVYVPGTQYRATTDDAGAYVMSGVPPGTHTLFFALDGYGRGVVGNLAVPANAAALAPSVTLYLALAGAPGGLALAGGAAAVPAPTVGVSLMPTSGAVAFKLSENKLFSDASWRPLVGETTFTFAGAGKRTLYVQYADANGQASSSYAADVIVDTAAPEVLFRIQQGAARTASATVTLDLEASDAHSLVGEFLASEAEDFGSANWTSFSASSPTFVLSSGDGQKTVFLKVRDAAGRESSVARGTVVLDTKPPAVPVIAEVVPRSPSASKQPRFIGAAEAGTRVELFTSADCSGTPVASGDAESFAMPGLDFETTANRIEVRAVAIDAVDNRSACSSAVAYARPYLVKDITQVGDSSPEIFISLADAAVFQVINGGQRYLWRTDGTKDGTYRLGKLEQPGGNAYQPVRLGGVVVFVANDGVSGSEVWRTDGTVAGTFRLADIQTGVGASSSPQYLTSIGAKAVFCADDGSGFHLWVTDGEVAGTTKIKTVCPGNGSDELFRSLGEKAVFMIGDELWKTDGTGPGTVLVVDLNGGFVTSGAHTGVVNGKLVFPRNDNVVGTEPWITDGTPEGTFLLKDVHASGGSSPERFKASGNRVYFTAVDADHGREMWVSDGTTEGTVLLADIVTGSGDGVTGCCQPIKMQAHDGLLYFSASHVIGGSLAALWKTDGTPSGTKIVRLLREDVAMGSNFETFASHGNLIFFVAADGRGGYAGDLWGSDGTNGGTTKVIDVTHAAPRELFMFKDLLLFNWNDNEGRGAELWAIDLREAAP